ncbi:MAG: hypothetical protein H0W83_13735 [Planctomycetes bacterium]|nr:hypothetical protein [Planctomycetota bacterium]
MLRGLALFGLLFHLLAGSLPAGSLVRLGSDGLTVSPQQCCGMVTPPPGHESQSVTCCCYTGIMVGHQDLAAAAPVNVPLAAAVVTSQPWPPVPMLAASAAAPRPSLRVRDGPPPIGLAFLSTIVIRC